MPEPKQQPPLGGYEIPALRTCTRLVGWDEDREIVCGLPGVLHIDWGEAAGFVCADHEQEARDRWSWQAAHPLTDVCGLPGTLWVDGTPHGFCVFPEGGLPTAEPVRAVADPCLASTAERGSGLDRAEGA